MNGRHTILAMVIAGAVSLTVRPARPRADERQVRIDVPVTLESASLVFNMDHLAFRGDEPVGIRYMRLVARRLRDMGTKGHVVAIFHGDAAYMTLADRAYNAFRGVSTGNPYKQMLADLASEGVQLEECAVTMRDHGWTNEDLLPVVRVNAGAVSRIVQLVQQGYVQIEP